MFRIIIRVIYVFLFIVSFLCFIYDDVVASPSSSVTVVKVEGTIVPVVADYIDRAITQAEDRGSTACILELNTPGGLLNSTEKIVQRILNAKIPIVVFVTPQGAWAASAGTFITISAHIAVMSPGSTIGAAHPVSVGEEAPEEVTKKATEYSAAWIRSIAEQRGRNPQQAELAVTESKSFTADEALKNNLIDYLADDIGDLLDIIHNQNVILADGSEVTVQTEGVVLIEVEMTLIEGFINTISDPNIAYILLSLASIGLFTEIANPGLIFPGVTGGICLFLSLYALGALNAYWAGLVLILLAFGLFIAELFTSASGILTAGGVISLVLGSFLLFINNPPALRVDPWLIVTVVVIIVAILGLILFAVIRGQRRKIETGREALVGKIAVVKTLLNPKGMVFVEGEIWNARLGEGQAEAGEEVIVKEVDGLKLIVEKKRQKGE